MSELAACAHTKIKEVKWDENHGTSSKFMCLNCNTDFVPMTGEIRDFLWRKSRMSVVLDGSGAAVKEFHETPYE